MLNIPRTKLGLYTQDDGILTINTNTNIVFTNFKWAIVFCRITSHLEKYHARLNRKLQRAKICFMKYSGEMIEQHQKVFMSQLFQFVHFHIPSCLIPFSIS